MTMRVPREILHEYVFDLEGMSESIKARVMVDISAKPHPDHSEGLLVVQVS